MNDDVEITLQQDNVVISEPLVADYILPKASSTTLGGVKIGDNINISSDGHISVPMASADTLGLIKIGTGLSIDENGVVTASGEYVLPQATKTTLGGVYVDDALDGESLNPVQNSVVATAIDGVEGDLTTLSGTVGDLDDAVSTLSTTVGGFSGAISDLQDAVADNTENITTNGSNITALSNRLGNAEGDITDLGNGFTELSSTVDGLSADINEEYTYEDIDDTVWTAGGIDIRGKGYYAVLYIHLEGTLTISASSSATLYTLPADYIPRFDAFGTVDIIDGSISVKIDSSNGNISLINNNTSSVNAGKINAGIPIIYGSV